MFEKPDVTFGAVLGMYSESLHVRPALLRSDFARTTTLSDLLSDPAEALEQIRLVPNVGILNIERAKTALFNYCRSRFPEEWAASLTEAPIAPGDATGTGIDLSLVDRFRHLQDVWGYSDESLQVLSVYHGGYTNSDNTVFLAALAAQSAFVYAPESLPEILKTPAVFKAEQGWSRQRADYLERLKATVHEEIVLPEGSLVLLDRHRLHDLVEARGPYAGLSVSDVATQLMILRQALSSGDAPVTVVTDFRKNGLSSGFATADGPLIHYCFGGYLELRNPDMVALFHDKARAAAEAGMPLAAWFADLDLTNTPLASPS